MDDAAMLPFVFASKRTWANVCSPRSACLAMRGLGGNHSPPEKCPLPQVRPVSGRRQFRQQGKRYGLRRTCAGAVEGFAAGQLSQTGLAKGAVRRLEKAVRAVDGASAGGATMADHATSRVWGAMYARIMHHACLVGLSYRQGRERPYASHRTFLLARLGGSAMPAACNNSHPSPWHRKRSVSPRASAPLVEPPRWLQGTWSGFSSAF